MLARSRRIRKGYEFRRIRGRGFRFESPSFFAFALPVSQQGRLGVVVSAKIGKATKRKRAARVLRSGFQEAEQSWQRAVDLILIARPVVLKKKSGEVAEELRRFGRWVLHQ